MARLNRLVVPHQVHLVVQSCTVGLAPFSDPSECDAFLATLRRASVERGVTVQGYVLLPDTYLLLATPADVQSLGRMMQAISRWYSAAFNRRHGRSGAMWRGRFAAAPVSQPHVVDVLRYVEQAPVRARLVPSAREHRWSSVHLHASGSRDVLLLPSAALWALGNTPFEREAAYRHLVESPLPAPLEAQIEATAVKGWPLADKSTLLEWAAASGRRTHSLPRGRPRSTI